MSWVLHLSTSEPGLESYDGDAWDQAGIRDQRKPVYEDRSEAGRLAYVLSRHNPVIILASKVRARPIPF